MTLLKCTVRSVLRMLTQVKQSTGSVVMLFMSPGTVTITEYRAPGPARVTQSASQGRR